MSTTAGPALGPFPVPTPMSALPGERGLGPQGPVYSAPSFPGASPQDADYAVSPSAPCPRLRELPPPRLHDVHPAAYSPPAVEEVRLARRAAFPTLLTGPTSGFGTEADL